MKMKDIVKGEVYVHKHPNGGIAPYKVKGILNIPQEYANHKGKRPTLKTKLVIQLVCLRDGSERGVNNIRGFICKHEGK